MLSKTAKPRAIAYCCAGLLGAAGVSAQEQLFLEEVVVTAQKRAESLSDVPISVNAVSGQKLSDAGLTEIADITAYVPSLTMNETGIGTNISIRGISSGINQGFEQSVGMYIDDIYFGRAQLARAPFLDLERIEVLRGPQSILFGKNSIAGAVSMTTARPSDEFEGNVTALFEPDHGEKDLRLALSGPITGSVRGRLAVLYHELDGFYDNTALNEDEPQDENKVVRGTIEWDITDNLTGRLKLETGTFDAQGRFLEVVNPVSDVNDAGDVGVSYAELLAADSPANPPLDTEQNFKRQSNGDFSENDTDNATLTFEYDLGEHTLTLISGYNAYDYEELCDCEFVGADIFTLLSEEEWEQFSQEIRLTSPGGETFDYIAGLFYQSYELEFRDSFNIPTNSLLARLNPLLAPLADTAARREFTQDSDLWSVFGQVTWNFSEYLRLTLGGRFTAEDKDGSRRQTLINAQGEDVLNIDPALNTAYGLFNLEAYDTVEGSRSENAFTPLVTIQYDVTDDIMLYATYTTGFKSGGYDVRSNGHPDPAVMNGVNVLRQVTSGGADDGQIVGTFEFEEEEATSFELGSKMVLWDGRADLNVAVFHTEYTDLQTSQFDGTLGFNVTNAGEATIQGLELDGRVLLTEGLTLSGSLAYLDFEFDDFKNSQCFFTQARTSDTNNDGLINDNDLCDITGQRREFTPEYSANISANYLWPITDSMELSFTFDVIYSDEYLASPTLDPNLVQDSYVQINARIALNMLYGDLSVALVGKNLTDEEILTFGNQLPVSTTVARNSPNGNGVESTAYYGFYDRPANVALQVRYEF